MINLAKRYPLITQQAQRMHIQTRPPVEVYLGVARAVGYIGADPKPNGNMFDDLDALENYIMNKRVVLNKVVNNEH